MKEKYNFIEHLQPYDIILTYKKTSLFSKYIWKFTKPNKPATPVSHSIIYYGDNLIGESTFLAFSLFNCGGVVLRSVKNYKETSHIITIKRLKNTYRSSLNEELIKERIQRDATKVKYAFTQVLKLFINKLIGNTLEIKDEEGAVCSEWVADIFEQTSNIKLVPGVENHKVEPLQIFNSDKLALVYKSTET